MSAVNNNIIAERKRLGMSQEELGRILGRDRSAISRMERNPMSLTGDMIARLSDIFCCSSDYLLGLTDERVPRHSVVAT